MLIHNPAEEPAMGSIRVIAASSLAAASLTALADCLSDAAQGPV